MNIEIPVADLKPILPGLSKIIPKRATLPVLSCVKVTLNPDRTLHIQSTNLDQFVTARLNKSFNGNPGVLLVPFEELSGIVKKCSGDDTIELIGTGKETSINFPAPGTRIRKSVEHLAVDEFPPSTEVNTDPVQLDEAFKEALQQALECACTDSSRYVLNGACLDVTKKKAHYVVGTNGTHLYTANSFLFDVPNSIIVPQSKFLTWRGFVDDGPWTLRYLPAVKGKGKTGVGARPAWIRLDSDHWTVVTKPIDGTYPNWEQVVPTEQAPIRIILGEGGVKTILDAVPLLPGNEANNQPVSLETTGNDLLLKARMSLKDEWNRVPVPAQVSGPAVCISLNRTYLTRALRFGCTEIAIRDELSPLVFSTKGKIIVVMPLRPDEAPATARSTGPATPPSTAQATAAAESTTSPPENASAEIPSPAESNNNSTELERTSMPQNVMTPPARGGNLNGQSSESDTENSSAIDEMIAQIGTVREGIKKVLDDLTATEKLVRKAVKEQKLNEKEINRARSALRSLQNVEI